MGELVEYGVSDNLGAGSHGDCCLWDWFPWRLLSVGELVEYGVSENLGAGSHGDCCLWGWFLWRLLSVGLVPMVTVVCGGASRIRSL